MPGDTGRFPNQPKPKKEIVKFCVLNHLGVAAMKGFESDPKCVDRVHHCYP